MMPRRLVDLSLRRFYLLSEPNRDAKPRQLEQMRVRDMDRTIIARPDLEPVTDALLKTVAGLYANCIDENAHGSSRRHARAQKRLETSQSDAFTAPRLRLAPGTFGLTAESGFSGGSAGGSPGLTLLLRSR